jgi:5'-methylthioadenosine phosphorylase
MKESIAPGEFVVVDQFIDLTRRRESTFFDEGVAVHVPFGDPVCADLSRALVHAAERAGAAVQRGGTYVCMEGPQFSTRAESLLYRSWGVSVIGMTAMPEAKLAREAELPYALLALATDYDCWHQSEAHVSADAVVAIVQKNAAAARRTVAELAALLPDPAASAARGVMSTAILTAREKISATARARLEWLFGNIPG